MTMTPREAWEQLLAGNARFVAGQPQHPNQDTAHRNQLSDGQTPCAIVFGCGDSRVAAELIFDQGLGDLFVVRTAGHVTDDAVMGSLEYGVEILGIPLVVVLGHDNCGAVKAAIDARDSGVMPPGYIRDVVERLIPSLLAGQRQGIDDYAGLISQHVSETVGQLTERSRILFRAVRDGRCAIVGLEYALSAGSVRLVEASGLDL